MEGVRAIIAVLKQSPKDDCCLLIGGGGCGALESQALYNNNVITMSGWTAECLCVGDDGVMIKGHLNVPVI